MQGEAANVGILRNVTEAKEENEVYLEFPSCSEEHNIKKSKWNKTFFKDRPGTGLINWVLFVAPTGDQWEGELPHFGQWSDIQHFTVPIRFKVCPH